MIDQQTQLPYVQVVAERPVERFLQMVILSQRRIDQLVLVSPIIGPLHGASVSMARILEKIDRERIMTYVVTNEPRPDFPSHLKAVSMLSESDFTEVRFNPSLHAKLYVCRFVEGGLALLGSGNLTETSIRQRTELGVIVFHRGAGIPLLNELFEWGTVRLRTMGESKLAKRMRPRR